MPKIAAFIPVYKVPKRAVSLVQKLSAEAFPDSCIYVVVDGETTPEIASALTQICGLPRVVIVEGNPHWGKAVALNHAVASVQVENLVFFDNDITVPDDITIFGTCVSLLQHYDIVEMPKEGVGKGLLAAMGKFEFLANIIGAKVYADIVGQCPSINGAAFCVRDELFDRLNGFAGVVNEDVDFAARGLTISFLRRPRVSVALFLTFSAWLRLLRAVCGTSTLRTDSVRVFLFYSLYYIVLYIYRYGELLQPLVRQWPDWTRFLPSIGTTFRRLPISPQPEKLPRCRLHA